MMTGKSFEELFIGYVNSLLTQEELARFLQLVQQEEHKAQFQACIDGLFIDASFTGQANRHSAEGLFQNIMQAAGNAEHTRQSGMLRVRQNPGRSFLHVAMAAALTGLLVLTSYFWFKKEPGNQPVKTALRQKPYPNDFPPAASKALLTLADGSTIVLDDAQNGAIARQGNTNLTKLNGKLNYMAAGGATRQTETLYNTISTPRGGQYQVALPDGSQVWLNAASSLRFPAAFTGKQRSVEVTGEAYFEVTANKIMPFVVHVNGAQVQVLGTHFNIMAYNDESSLNTTLMEGAVTFIQHNITQMLKPGQQAQLHKNGQLKLISGMDADEVVAWKNGIFNFQGAQIGTVARQLARWYDVDITYKNNVEDLFYAKIPRNTKLSDVLKALELTGKVHFEIEGRKIIVMP